MRSAATVLAVLIVAAASTVTTAGAAHAATALASGPDLAAGAGPATCTPPEEVPSGDIVVPIVVDFGSAGGKVLVTCLVAKPGESGAQLLQAQAALLGLPVPAYDPSGSGLLCAIDGYPRSGCGAQSGSHYAYWAYWHGGTQWHYASGGPAAWVVTRGDVEGWRFEPDGSATAADPPPRAPSSVSGLETTPAPVGATTTTAQPVAGQTTTTTLTAGGQTTTTAPPADPGTTSSTDRTTVTSSRQDSTTASRPAVPVSSRPLPPSDHSAGPVRDPGTTGGGTSPFAFLVGAALILLLGAGAVWRSRRSRDGAS